MSISALTSGMNAWGSNRVSDICVGHSVCTGKALRVEGGCVSLTAVEKLKLLLNEEETSFVMFVY